MNGAEFALILLLAGLCYSANAFSITRGEARPSVIDRAWPVEAEFDEDRSLHATGGQVVALHLETSCKPGRGGIRNRTRLAVEVSRDFRFCIPQSDPHLVRVKVKRAGGGSLLNQLTLQGGLTGTSVPVAPDFDFMAFRE